LKLEVDQKHSRVGDNLLGWGVGVGTPKLEQIAVGARGFACREGEELGKKEG